MSILTIAREHGVWTTEAGEVLARRLNAVLLTKEELERRLIDAGMTQKTFQRYDEKKPGFFSSLSSDMDLYILYLKTIMLEVAQESNVIILGRGAHLMLGNLPNCLRVRLVAPIEFRVETVKKEYGYDTDTASRIVRRCDADRSGFCFFHFNEQWADATKYDLTINTATISQENLAELLQSQLDLKGTQENEAKAKKLIANQLLAQKVSTALLVVQKISLAFLDVTARCAPLPRMMTLLSLRRRPQGSRDRKGGPGSHGGHKQNPRLNGDDTPVAKALGHARHTPRARDTPLARHPTPLHGNRLPPTPRQDNPNHGRRKPKKHRLERRKGPGGSRGAARFPLQKP